MLTHEEIQRDPQRITKIKTFINRYNWKEQNFKSREDDWKKIEKENLTVVLNIFYAQKDILLMFQNNSNRI